MSNDLTIKQERFAIAYVETGNASEAYRRAYDAENMGEHPLGVEASRLLAHPVVALKVAEIQAEYAADAKLTPAIVLKDIGRQMRQTERLDKPSAALKASELRGKAIGMFGDTLQVTGRIEHVVAQLEGLSLEELRAISRGEDPEALGEGSTPQGEGTDA